MLMLLTPGEKVEEILYLQLHDSVVRKCRRINRRYVVRWNVTEKTRFVRDLICQKSISKMRYDYSRQLN